MTGFIGSLEEILITALLLPVDTGANVIVAVQELPFVSMVQSFV